MQSGLIALSYIRWKLFPCRQEETFEEWVTNRFGKRLFETFFKSYTEKVWGIPCSELRAEWAAQRIKNLSLKMAVVSMFDEAEIGRHHAYRRVSLPALGPGMMWNAAKAQIEQRGGTVLTESEVVGIHRTGSRVTGVTVRSTDRPIRFRAAHVISSMPVAEFLQRLDPPPPAAVLEAAGRLKYRDFLTVCLIVDRPDLFPDNWIYVHDPEVKVGHPELQNWSPEMVPDPGKTSLGLEYFCNEGDELWSMPDGELIELGRRELEYTGLVKSADVVDGCVFRVPKSYPVYDSGYRDCLATIKGYVDGLDNFQTVGRNGLHRYNNQDHSMEVGHGAHVVAAGLGIGRIIRMGWPGAVPAEGSDAEIVVPQIGRDVAEIAHRGCSGRAGANLVGIVPGIVDRAGLDVEGRQAGDERCWTG